jgi:hypothetical protein
VSTPYGIIGTELEVEATIKGLGNSDGLPARHTLSQSCAKKDTQTGTVGTLLSHHHYNPTSLH